jgi:RNA polymerase sigma-70 factor (ECF subfamily)
MRESEGGFNPVPVISSILAGNKEAFRLLVREYGLLLRGYLAARLHHLEDIDDLAQDVFIAAFDGLGSCDPSKFQEWLLGIARNHVRLHWRTKGRRDAAMARFRQELAIAVEEEVDESFRLEKAESVERLLDCISELPERIRKIIRASLDGIRADALAEELGVNRNALYQARFRGFAALRKCMEFRGA